MKITLKNELTLDLEVSPLFLEYVEDYEGGIDQLEKDLQYSDRRMLAINHMLYAIVASNYDEPVTYRQALKLINIKDMEKIVDFLLENISNLQPKTETLKKHRMK